MTQFFGASVRDGLWSAQWNERKDAVESAKLQVDGSAMNHRSASAAMLDMEAYVTTAFQVAHRALDDAVAPVNFAGLDLLQCVVATHITMVSADTTRPCFRQLTPRLVQKMAVGNKRLQRQACDCILLFARQRAHQGLAAIAPHILSEELPLRARLTLLQQAVPESRLSKGCGLTVASVMGVAVPALAIAEEKTRAAAVGVVEATYRVAGKRVLKHLTGVKPVLLKILHRRFQEVDQARAGGAASVGSSEAATLAAGSAAAPSPARPSNNAASDASGMQALPPVSGSAYLPSLGASGVRANSAPARTRGDLFAATTYGTSPLAPLPDASPALGGASPAVSSKLASALDDADELLMDRLLA